LWVAIRFEMSGHLPVHHTSSRSVIEVRELLINVLLGIGIEVPSREFALQSVNCDDLGPETG